ncbi:phospholipase D family protein [Povalibacter sp.]|uniref:phospholipase D family protein n=1 Tax=Povalibacter sp. TaxID=1962978 RepID=UPI002F414AE3
MRTIRRAAPSQSTCISRSHLIVVLAAFALAACSSLQDRPALPVEKALPVSAESTELDRLLHDAESRRAGQSAFRLLKEGPEAFAVRVQSARMAGRSLDVQTYIWHADLTGGIIAQELLAAADRGVKVRLLVDDMDARAKNSGFAALSAHPNIDVRLFNPFASRSGFLGFVSEGLSSFKRINRRMHNKTWIADNRIAVAGGRNIGDEYFGASDEVNFIDLDFAMLGPVVRDASASFDKYWNSASAYPMEFLDKQAVSDAELQKLRSRLAETLKDAGNSRYAKTLREDNAIKRMAAGDWPIEWAHTYRFVSDDPGKVTMTKRDAKQMHVAAILLPELQATQSQASIISPYFVPGDVGTDGLVSVAKSGKQVRILTNSLVANDVAAVHGGYSGYRPRLLEGGVQLWELKPQPGEEIDSSLFGSSGASLHTKAFAVDHRMLFVGSYNLDPRSTWLNCEQGVLVENEVLARQLEDIFTSQTTGDHAWHVTLQNDRLHWTDGNENFDSDPKAGVGRRFQAWFARVLGLEGQL